MRAASSTDDPVRPTSTSGATPDGATAPLAGALGRQVRSGVLWSGLSSVVLKLTGLGVSILAARLLSPEEFGVFAVALTVHAIVLNVSDLGVSAYLVRHEGDVDEVAPTVTTVALVTSLLLATAMVATAPAISGALGAVEAADAVRALSITVLLAGVSAVPNAILVREFRQDKRFAAEGASFVASTAVLIPLALLGFGAMALAWSRVAGHVVSTVMFVLLARRFYLPRVDRTQLVLLLVFGLPLVGNTLLGFAIGNLDYVVVGRMLGAEALGAYYLAYNLASWPFLLLSPVLAGVAMAAFSRLRGDPQRFGRAVGTTLGVVLAVSMPLSTVLVCLSAPLVQSVYGPKWSATIAPLAMIALFGALRIPVDVFSNVAIALGRTRQLLLTQVAYCAALAPLMVLLVSRSGIVGAATAHVIAVAAVLLPTLLWVITRDGAVSLRLLASAALRPTAASAVAGAAAWLCSTAVTGSWTSLLLGLAAGTVVYGLLMRRWLLSLRGAYAHLVADGRGGTTAAATPPRGGGAPG